MSTIKNLEDAITLVEDAMESLKAIQVLYDKSIREQEIDRKLLVKMKNVFENLRSSLDFCAHAMVDEYSTKKPSRVYFPYASLEIDKLEFLSKKRIEKAIPDLKEKKPELYALILSMQHFSHPGAKWFPEFMELNNKNKHVHLVPNSLSEGVALSSGTQTISAKSIRIGKGGSIRTNQRVLKGPITITPESIGGGAQFGAFSANSWQAIFIEGYGFPNNAFQFTSHCVRAISSVVRQIKSVMP